MTNNLIYFDNNSTTRVDEEVIESMLPYFRTHYGNASGKSHAFGWTAEAAVETSRIKIASLLNCEPSEIYFTSGATESINLALKGIYQAYKKKGNHIITCKTEHKAVLDCCRYLEEQGALVTYLDVDAEGMIDLDGLKNSINENTILVSLMAANNETGVFHPIEKIAEICRERNILFFSDATQYAGKERCDISELNVHALALSGHKFHGPKGVGLLFLKRKDPRVNILPQIHGGGQQNGKRAGTLNVPLIVGLAKALEIASSQYWENSTHISKIKNHFEHQLLEIQGLRINGSTRSRLHTTSNICFPEHLAIHNLLKKFAFSQGSSCTSELLEPSHVLKAMGMEEKDIKNSFRFSFSKYNSIQEADEFLKAVFAL